MDPPMIIDFERLEGRVFTGRPRGEALRARYGLDKVDSTHQQVEIKIPKSVYSLTSSFFLGFFGPSVVASGSPQKFFERFHFDADAALQEAFSDYVARALQDKQLFRKTMH